METMYNVTFLEGEDSGATGGFYFASAQLEFSDWKDDTHAVYTAIVPSNMETAFEQYLNAFSDCTEWERVA